MRLFRPISGFEIPWELDLRRCGWRLAACGAGDPAPGCGCPSLGDIGKVDAAAWVGLMGADGAVRRRWIVLAGVAEADERARLLRLGFGDVLPPGAPIAEVEARAQRVAEVAGWLPRHRHHGPLRLDIVLREGFVDDRPLRLHPREFALLWRLAEQPGTALSRPVLLADVWRLRHEPETNSLAVHVSRLRAKLAAAGVRGLLGTSADGGYFLCPVTEYSLHPGEAVPGGAVPPACLPAPVRPAGQQGWNACGMRRESP